MADQDAMLAKLLDTECLPSPPQVALKVLQTCQDTNKGAHELSQVLVLDSALSAKVLRIANSAAYSRGRVISTISSAIATLGMRSISVIALGFSLKRGIPLCGHHTGLNDTLLWRHSVATAVASRSLARLLKYADCETAFLCGLMSRIGQLLMLSVVPDEYHAAIVHAQGNLPSAAEELQVLGVSHHQVGRLLLEKWNLPRLYCDVVEKWGNDDLSPGEDEFARLATFIKVGDAARALLFDEDKATGLKRIRALAQQHFGISQGEIDRMFVACQQELRETLLAFDDSQCNHIDCESIMETARQQLIQLSLGIAADLTQAKDDASSLEEANRDLQKASLTDPLTGLPNRAALEQELVALRHVRSRGNPSRPFTIFMVDVDHFKKFNDTHGHAVGDQVLRAVANTLVDSARATDFVARYGGEEFTVILSNAGKAEALAVAERYRAAIENCGIELKDKTLSVTASFGIASSDSFIGSAAQDAILKAADAALYQAKQQGRNRVVAHGQLEPSRTGS